MKKRIVKKKAMNFLRGNWKQVKCREDSGYGWNGEVTKVFAILHPAVEHEVRELARSRFGWDGCHWDDPLVVDILDPNDSNDENTIIIEE